jgi:anti-sigma B factor antagonist
MNKVICAALRPVTAARQGAFDILRESPVRRPLASAAKVPTITNEQGVTVIAPGPEYEHLDDSEIETLKSTLFEAASQTDPPLVVLDLSRLRFFGSAFIEALFRTWTHVNSRPGGKLSLCGLNDYCREVVEITHLDRLWTVFPTRAEALQALRRS